MMGFLLGRTGADLRTGTWCSETAQALLVLPDQNALSERVIRKAQVAISFLFHFTDKSILNTANSDYTQK